ncbi:MAG TPA: hypothetical protein DCQ30_14025 [Acidimicrobiaceae bacterium]|nr:hypothetical protein [Acidimicrobiaceae bacterium]
MPASSAVCPVHIGRDAEVGRLGSALRSRTLVLVGGEAGVGKSRLASEALRLAGEQGLTPMVGYCAPEAGIPYAPFVTAIRRRTRTLDEDALRRLFDGAALLASALLPEAARTAGLPEDSTPREEDLFAAVWQLLCRLSGQDGSVLLLEDLHWADTDGLRLLSYLARESADLNMWLVGTYRTDELHRRHPLTTVLAELARQRRYEEIRLEPLGREDLRRMVSAILDGTEVGDEFLDAVLDRTDGNPFFVEELIKVLVERGDIFRQSGDWARRDLADIEMPVTVRETLLTRARTLDDQTQRVLQIAALAGERLDPAVISIAAAVDDNGVAEAVRQGLGLQLLVERRDGPATFYAFRHALTREALADELVGPDRQQAHRRIADAMRAVHSHDLDALSSELADHYANASETAEAVEFGIRAARFAAASFAWDEVGRRYEYALRLMESDSPQRLQLLLEAAERLRNGPDPQLLTSFCTEAQRLARLHGDKVAEGLALCIQQAVVWDSGDTPRALASLRDAYELVRGSGEAAEATVVSRLVRMLVLSGEGDEASARIPEALKLAEGVGNHAALSGLHGSALILGGFGPEFDEHYHAALDAARAGNDVMAELNLTTNAGYVNIWWGYFARSRPLLERAMELGERYSPSSRYEEAGFAWLLSLTGDYDEAWGRAEAISRGAARVPSRIVALGAMYEVAERRGLADAGAVVDEIWALAARTGEGQRTVPALSARARHALLHGDLESATPLFWEVMGATRTEAGTGSHWMFAPDLSRVLAEQDRVSDLERWVAAVRQLTDADPHPHNLAAQALCVAYLSMSHGEQTGGDEFEGAARRFQSLPCPARQAEALLGSADAAYRANALEASAEAARRALAVAEAIGAGELTGRGRRAIDRVEQPPVLATVLFTDIVGSTERLSAVGDRAWSQVLDRHNNLVRREVSQWKGHEVNTTGDGFVVWFETPAQGIRCALALRQSLAQAGITVRAGLHTGECQLSGENLTGIAVHTAARVSALAGPGEVLVSRTVRDLVSGGGISLTDRGVHTLKGVEGDWQLFAVSS